jgi:hypothetical protein
MILFGLRFSGMPAAIAAVVEADSVSVYPFVTPVFATTLVTVVPVGNPAVLKVNVTVPESVVELLTVISLVAVLIDWIIVPPATPVPDIVCPT